MFDKFTFYDFLGYLLPGSAVVLMVYWVGKAAFGVPFPELQADLTTSFVFLGVSYVAGHLVQSIGSAYERKFKWKDYQGRRVRLSEWLLLCPPRDWVPPDKQFTTDLRDRIGAAAKDVFDATDDVAELFEQCYALLVQKSLTQHIEVFGALNGLARGMLMATGVGFLLAALVTIQQIILLLLASNGVHLAGTGMTLASSRNLFIALGAMPPLVGIGYLFEYEFNRFRYYFAKAVYWNFLAWYGAKTMATTKTKSGWLRTLLGV